jgi:hypothetical protein
MDAPSVKSEHEEHKANLEEFKKKKKPESKLKTKTKMGEHNYRKMSVSFHVEAKVEMILMLEKFMSSN